MKYALIGCGRIATNHVKAVLNNKLEFVAACDVNLENIEALLAKHDLQNDKSIARYSDYKKMLAEHPEIELVAIATSSGIHAEIALHCIDCGKNVIIEKPMAMNMKDADEIIKRSHEKGVVVSVSHQNRFNVAVQKLRTALEAGRFGKLSHGSINVRWNRGKSYYDQATWRGTWADDGGCLMNQCIHGIDLLRWMFGEEIDTVYGVTKQQQHDYLECEDVGQAVITFKNGAVATIEGTTNVFPKNLEETLYVFGEKGTVKIGGTSTNNIDVWNFADETEADQANKGLEEQTSNVYGNGHTSLYADVIDAITNHRKPYVDAVAGRNALEVVLAIYKSAATGKPVKLPLTDCASTDFAGRFDNKQAKGYFAHESSYVDDNVEIGEGTKIWHFCHVMGNTKIGKKCNIGQNCVVGPNAILGNNVKVQNNVSIYDGVEIEDDVFCGPSMVFTNVINPRSHVSRKHEYKKTKLCKGTTIGANATVVCGHTLGKYTFVGAGSVVTKDTPDYAMLYGNPARIHGYMCQCGIKLINGETLEEGKTYECQTCHTKYTVRSGKLVELS